MFELDGNEIAIIGMAGRFPGAADLDTFWRNLRDGVESVAFPSRQALAARGVDPATLADPAYVRAVAVLDDMDMFDAAFFGMSHREAEITDPQHRVFLECAWEALERAGYLSDHDTGSVGVFGGAATNTYLLFNLAANPALLRSLDPVQVDIANAADHLTTRTSYKLNLQGPSYSVQSACSTSLVAVHVACQSLLNKECDIALAGGVTVNVTHPDGYRHVEGGIVSPDGHCRAFDARAEGTIFSSGAGVVVLKRLDEALEDGDTVYAVIRGSAINNDGVLKVGYTAPGGEGQTKVVSEALEVAGIEPATIDYIEAHGTGTAMGDPIEIQALTRVFAAGTQRRQFCAIGSLKTNIGHLAAAAGVAGLIKTTLALQHRQIPPSLHYEQPNPEIDFAAGPFYVNTTLSEWRAAGRPRRAGVSSFGVGGTNAHLVLEEAPAPEPSDPGRPWQLLTLSAKTATALEAMAGNLAAHLRAHPEQPLADVAYTLQLGRRSFDHRRVLLCANREDAIQALSGTGHDRYAEDAAFRDAVDRYAAQIAPLLDSGNGPDLASQPDEAVLLGALGRLWQQGATVDWSRLYRGQRRRRVPLPTYPFERRRYWIEPPRAAPAVVQATPAAPAPARPRHPRPNLLTPFVAPDSAMERSVAAIVQDALGVEQIGVYDNFFDLGGDSLSAVHVIDQIKKELAIEIPVVSLYESLTVRSLVEVVHAHSAQGAEQHDGLIDELEQKAGRRKQFQQMQRSRKRGGYND
ncbi:MAG: hypothetical protein OHK0022_55940 [Roseiflexaceae bacterium]